jgi:hypothetical protein
MSNERGNRGVQVFGGSVNAAAIVAGERASATVTAGDDPRRGEILARLDELLRLVQVERDGGHVQERIRADATNVREELARPVPDKARVASIVERIAEGVKSFASLATAAHALKAAVLAFL